MFQRTPELGLLRAVGMTRSQVRAAAAGVLAAVGPARSAAKVNVLKAVVTD